MNVRTFRIGGVHPEENKLTHDVATKVAALPKQADCRGWWFCLCSYL